MFSYKVGIKEINRLRKEINTLLSKGMSNIYLKLHLRRSQNFDFLGLKNFWGAPTHADIIEFKKFLLQL